MTVFGTRPEIIRLSAVINKLDSLKSIEHVLVHTGQNYDYELNEIFFSEFHIKKPDYFLNAATKSPVETIGNILTKIDAVLQEVEPDAFLILGDTNSCLAAIAAKKRQIPIFHMEAGNRCFDQRVPEETNRKIVDHISDINLPYSSIAREYLLHEGIPADRIIKTGSPMFEVLMKKKNLIYDSNIVQKLNLEKGKYFLLSAHREENINSDNFMKLIDTINAIAEKYSLPIIISAHPRTRNMINEKGVIFNNLVQVLKPLGFIDYNKLQIDSKVVLSDSGTISEESAILKFDALNIREAHERPEAMEEGTVIMTGLDKENILRGIDILEERTCEIHDVLDYSFPNVSEKIVKIIISYTDYINSKVWMKK
jgi:UDP-N-acetylglucosamine 2-epimerase (non-hydrolysing)